MNTYWCGGEKERERERVCVLRSTLAAQFRLVVVMVVCGVESWCRAQLYVRTGNGGGGVGAVCACLVGWVVCAALVCVVLWC